MAWPPVPAMATRAQQFDELVLDAASRLEHQAGKAFGDIEFAVEEFAAAIGKSSDAGRA